MASLGARPSLDHFRQPAVLIKVPEIILLLVAVITYSAGANGEPAYVASVLLPCLLNALVFMTNYALGYSQLKHTPVELALYTYYVIGIFISAILLLSRNSGSLIASGVFCIILTLFYCLEVYFSYTGLVNRVPLPPNTQEPDATQGNNPNLPTITGAPPSYSSSPAPMQFGADTVDLERGVGPWPAPTAVYNTNPVYPATMNYPPYPAAGTPTSTSTATAANTSTLPPKTQEPHP